jgi:hypothetical protein
VLKLGEQLENGQDRTVGNSDVTANNNIKKVIINSTIAMTEKDKYHDNPSGQE